MQSSTSNLPQALLEIEEALDKALDKIAEVISAAISLARDSLPLGQKTMTTSCSNFTTSVENVSICV